MGWKTASIVCTNASEPQYFASLPTHLPDEATRIAKLLGYEIESRQECALNDYPVERNFVIGAYEKGIYLADRDIIFKCFDNREHPFFKTALQFYPGGELLMVVAHSVVNYFGYAYYRQGKLIREYSASGDDGVMSEIGEIQPEEAAAFAASEIRDGERIFKTEFRGIKDECTADCYGDELCFMMLGRYFGDYMQGDICETLMVEEFVKDTRPKFGSLSSKPDATKSDATQKSVSNDGSIWSGIKRLFGR